MSPSMLFYIYLTLLLIRTSRQSKVKSIEVKNLRRQMKLTENRINHELKGENQTIDEYVDCKAKYFECYYGSYFVEDLEYITNWTIDEYSNLISTNNESMCDVFTKPNTEDIILLDMKLNTRRNYIHVYYYYLIKYRILTKVLGRIETVKYRIPTKVLGRIETVKYRIPTKVLGRIETDNAS